MEFTAKEIAHLLNGRIEGDSTVKVNRLSKIEEGTAGSLSFLANPQYTQYIYTTNASIVIVNKDFCPEKSISSTLIRVENAYQSFGKLLDVYNCNNKSKKGIEKFSFISETAKVGEGVYVGAFAYIGENAVIGKNVKLYPHVYIGDNVIVKDNTKIFSGVKIYQNCEIGSNCVIHAGVIIGGDGFGFSPQSNNNYEKIAQIGNVVIEDNIEIGANTTIDRATLGSTIIHKGVKIDNLVQIAHNVEVGENTVIAAQAGIAGSTKIGRDCLIGGQVGIIGHLVIADEVKIAAQSGIGSSIKEKGKIVQGSPSFNINDYRKSYVIYKKLPEIYKKLTMLEEKLVNNGNNR